MDAYVKYIICKCKFSVKDAHYPFLNGGMGRGLEITEAALQWCSYEKISWKYAATLKENTLTEVRFQ